MKDELSAIMCDINRRIGLSHSLKSRIIAAIRDFYGDYHALHDISPEDIANDLYDLHVMFMDKVDKEDNTGL